MSYTQQMMPIGIIIVQKNKMISLNVAKTVGAIKKTPTCQKTQVCKLFQKTTIFFPDEYQSNVQNTDNYPSIQNNLHFIFSTKFKKKQGDLDDARKITAF